jgi:recombination protein RecT
MATTPAEQKLAKLSFPNMLDRYKGEIARALPRHLNPDRLCRIALTCFRQNPRLAECSPASVFGAVVLAAQLGLEPGVLGQAYLIPYKNECQLIPGYQGLVELVRRSGLVQRIEAHVVRQGEKFTYKTGLKTVLEHEPLLEGTPGPLRFAYAVAEFRDGGYHVEVMAEDQINKIRDRSQGYIAAKKYNKETPWETDQEEMWRKTVLRRICKFLPKSPELVTALSLDDAAAQGRQAISVDNAVHGWEPPILEISTQDDRLAEKSKANLEEIKAKYAPSNEPDPEYEKKMQAEAERQKKAVEEKYGHQAPAPPTEAPAEPAPTQEQPTKTPEEFLDRAVVPAAESSSEPQKEAIEQHGLPNIFEDAGKKPKRKG